MKKAVREFSARYRAALEEYSAAGGEVALRQGYELGRWAIENGLGLLDVAAAYRRATAAVIAAARPREHVRTADRAGKFLIECLSPFEMPYRGYQDASAVFRLNAQLERRTEELEAVTKELKAFSYSLSHDLRAPLRSLDGFTELLLEECSDKVGPQGQEYLNRVQAASRRMADLIEAMLSLSRVSSAGLRREQVDLSGIARDVAAELQRSGPGRGVAFAITPGLTAAGDRTLLRAVVENLLGNAWKFTSRCAQAKIEFSALDKDGVRTFFVRDNGAGFDMAYAAKLFAPFQRLHSSAEFPGAGIGLATVQRVVHRHHGRVWAEGAVGKGATFYFALEHHDEAEPFAQAPSCS